MKKIIFIIICLFFIIPIFSYAKIANDPCTKVEDEKNPKQSNDACPYNDKQYPGGLKCNIATNYKGEKINKCINMTPRKTDWGQPCIDDNNCTSGISLLSNEGMVCNRATWECDQAAEDPDRVKGTICTRDKECYPGRQYCKIDKTPYGVCENKGDLGRDQECTSYGQCGDGLECFIYPGNEKGECRYTAKSRTLNEECTYDTECDEGLYCPASEKQVCQWSKSENTPCKNNSECRNGYCADAEGVSISNGGSKIPFTCRQGVQEGGECDSAQGSIKTCSYPLICKDSKCTGSVTNTTETQEQEAATKARKDYNLSVSNQIDQYCKADAKTGLITEGVSDDCWNCGNCGARDIMVVIVNVVNFTLEVIGIFAVFATIVSGFMYIISRGNPEKVEKAKGALTATVTGLVIVFTAWILINTMMTVLGYNCGQWYAPTFDCKK